MLVRLLMTSRSVTSVPPRRRITQSARCNAARNRRIPGWEVPDAHPRRGVRTNPRPYTGTVSDLRPIPPTPDDVMGLLRGVIDPELGSDIVSLGMAKGATVDEAGQVRVTVALTTAGCPLRAQI